MSRATRQFVWIMRLYALIYLVGGGIFFFRTEVLFRVINWGTKVFSGLSEIPMPSEKFWVVLATSMMALLFWAAFFSSIYPKAKSYMLMHLFAKMVSIAGFIFLFLQEAKHFAYIVGAVTDSSVFVTVLFFYVRNLVQPVPIDMTPPLSTPGGMPSASG